LNKLGGKKKMIFNAQFFEEAVPVLCYFNGAPSETLTLKDAKGTPYTTDTGTTGKTEVPIYLLPGTYTVTGSVSEYTRNVTITKAGGTYNAYPDGAVYWYGNGKEEEDTLYSVGGGIKTSSACYASGYGTGKGWLNTCEKPINEARYFGAQLNTPSSSPNSSADGYGRSSWINFPHASEGYSKINIMVHSDGTSYCGKNACRVGIGSDGEKGWASERATIGLHTFTSSEATRSALVGVGGTKGSTWRSLCSAIWRE
jgi:hypothetical protein